MARVTALIRRARQISQTEGLIPLARRGFPFMVEHFFKYQRLYLIQHDLSQEKYKSDILPRMDKFTFKMISINEEADELEADSLRFRSYVAKDREELEAGAIAFCFFVEQELACICWVAMTQHAGNAPAEPPYRVDFSNNEACHGGWWTNPKYRGMGLGPFCSVKSLQFLIDAGKVLCRGCVGRHNVASLKCSSQDLGEATRRGQTS
ncbi:hypothetical protein ACFLST_00425 [Chloroflexota bacterium]